MATEIHELSLSFYKTKKISRLWELMRRPTLKPWPWICVWDNIFYYFFIVFIFKLILYNGGQCVNICLHYKLVRFTKDSIHYKNSYFEQHFFIFLVFLRQICLTFKSNVIICLQNLSKQLVCLPDVLIKLFMTTSVIWK